MSRELFASGAVDYLLPAAPPSGAGIMAYEGGGLTFGEVAEYSANVTYGSASLPVTLVLKRAGNQVHAWINAASLTITPQGLFIYGAITTTTPIAQTLLPPSRASTGVVPFVQSTLDAVLGYITVDYTGVFTIGAFLSPAVQYYIGGLSETLYAQTSAYLGCYLA